MKFKKTILISLATFVIFLFSWQSPLISRLISGARMYLMSKERANYYRLDGLANIEDITEKLADDKTIPNKLRQPLLSGKRRILIFKYKSDG